MCPSAIARILTFQNTSSVQSPLPPELVKMVNFNSRSLLCLILAWVTNIVLALASEQENLNFLAGKAAYVSKNWQECVNHLEAALAEHDIVKDMTADCHLRCQDIDSGTDWFPSELDISRLSSKVTRIENCRHACDVEFDDDFDRLKVYSFLQHCYYQNQFFQRAASAVYTMLLSTPDDKTMASYLRFYTGLPDVVMDRVGDLDLPSSTELLEQAKVAINEARFAAAIELTEISLSRCLKEEARCGVRCLGRGHGGNANFTAQVALVHEMACRQRCVKDVVTLDGVEIGNLLAEHYHYLHYAYFNAGNVQRAVEAAASFLLVSPLDTRALAIVERYKRLLNARAATFTARREAIDYVRQRQLDSKLMQVVDLLVSNKAEQANGFIAASGGPLLEDIDNEVDSNPDACFREVLGLNIVPEETDNVLQEQMSEILCNNPNHDWTHAANLLRESSKQELASHFPMPLASVSKPEVDAEALRDELLQDTVLVKSGGTRVMAEGLANEEECKTLMDLAKVAVVPGNGYQGNAMPFSRIETHAGAGFRRAVNMTFTGEIGTELIDIMMDIGDRVKAYIERHFELRQRLYFQFSELVCRTSTIATVSGEHADAVSHPIHADNCHAQQDGGCLAYEYNPSLRYRDYSSLVYLNDDFEGGEFYFASNLSSSSIQTVVKPRCGRMVGFTSGRESLHGVHSVRNGRRCAVATWFTSTPAQRESSRADAQLDRDQIRLDIVLKKTA